VIIVIFFAVAFVFRFIIIFFFVWLLPKADIGSYRPTGRV